MAIFDRVLGTIQSPTKNTGSAGLLDDGAVGISAATALAGAHAELKLAEVEVLANAVDRQVDDIKSIQRIQSRLTTISDRLRSITIDGMSRREAASLKEQIDDMHEELGFEDLVALPGLEDFGTAVTAKAHTEVAGLQAENGVEKIWNWIIEMAGKLKDLVMTWWDSFFGSVESMKSFAEKVKEKAAKYNDDKDNKKVTIKGTMLYVGETKPNGGTIVTGIEKLKATVPNFLVKLMEASENACDAVTNAMGAAGETDETLNAAYGKLGNKIDAYTAGAFLPEKNLMGNKFVELVKGVEEKPQYTYTKETPAQKPSNDGDKGQPQSGLLSDEGSNTQKRKAVYDYLAKISYKVKGDESGKDKSFDMERLTRDQVESVAEAGIEMATEILEIRKSRQDSRKYADNVEKAAKNIRKTSDNLNGAAKIFRGELVAMGKAAISILGEHTSGATTAWTTHLVKVTNTALKVAEASI